MQIIDGKKIKEKILEEVKEGVSKLSFTPVFCDVLVGDDPVSLQYVNMKGKYAKSVGIDFHRAQFPADISTFDLVQNIKELNLLPHICGLIVQLPLPPSIDQRQVLDAIATDIDVDCLGAQANHEFYNGTNPIGYPTALACLKIIDSLGVDLSSKEIVVLGQGMLVGKPVTHLLSASDLKVQTIEQSTENKDQLLKNADCIISAIGQGKYLTGPMIKEGAIIIDAGTSESTGSIVGDVDLESVLDIAGFVSPVPGGVGPVTVAMLLQNVLTVAKKKL